MAYDLQIIQPFRRSSSQWIILYSFYIVFSICLISSFFSGTTLNIIFAGITLWFISSHFFPSGFTSALFFALVYQWLQVTIKIIYSTFNDYPLTSITEYPENIQKAFTLSIISLLILALGIQTQLKKITFSSQDITKQLDQYSTYKIFIFYVFFNIIIIPFLTFLGRIAPGVYQAAIVFIYFKWAIFIILLMSVFKKREMIFPFFILVGFEFATSLFSFFANYKSIMFYLLIGFTSLAPITKRTIFYSTLAGILIYLFSIFWTDIKGDYRKFLNRGTKSQAVFVTQSAANSYLYNKIINYNFSNYQKTKREFIDRISYIDYFSACLKYVPSKKSHEDGGVLKESILHVIMPRFIFSNKGRIDDSNHLNKYTGLSFSNYEKGVSFSLGYAGDFYIDFGEIIMFLFIFLFGVLIGYILLNTYINSPNILWGIGAISSSFELLYKFENSQIKFLGNLIWFWIMYFLINKFVIPHIHRYLLKVPYNN